MYDESRYFSCCQYFRVTLRDEAVRMPELHGGFCSEDCALLCFRNNNPPLDVVRQLQAGDNELSGQQTLQFDDLNSWAMHGGQYG